MEGLEGVGACFFCTTEVYMPQKIGILRHAVPESILPEDIEWKPFPAFPPTVRLAVIVGEPSQGGPYTIRVKVPRGVKLMPHKHPEDSGLHSDSGVFYIGLGDQFDAERLEAYPPGIVKNSIARVTL